MRYILIILGVIFFFNSVVSGQGLGSGRFTKNSIWFTQVCNPWKRNSSSISKNSGVNMVIASNQPNVIPAANINTIQPSIVRVVQPSGMKVVQPSNISVLKVNNRSFSTRRVNRSSHRER